MTLSALPLRLVPRSLPLARSYLASTSALMIGSAAQLVTFALLARGLGVEQFGLLITVTVATNIAAQLCGIGGTETLIRRVAPEPALYATALGHNLILIAGTGLVLTVGLAAALPRFVELSPDAAVNAAALLALILANVVLVRLILLAEQVFIARWQIGRANLVTIGFALGRTAAAALACGAFGVRTAADWAFWSAGAHTLMALTSLFAIRGFGKPRWAIMREEVRLGLYFTTPFVFRAVRQNADTLVLSLVASPEVVGAFNMARRIVETSILTVDALHRLIYPRLARASAAGYRAMVPMITRVTVAAVGLGVVTASGVWLIAPLMPWLFGKDFGGMIGDLRAMAFVLVLVVIHDIPAEVLGATARHGIRAALYNIGNLLGAAVSAALTYVYLLPGTFLALYLTEAALAAAFWTVLVILIRRSVPSDGPRPSAGTIP